MRLRRERTVTATMKAMAMRAPGLGCIAASCIVPSQGGKPSWALKTERPLHPRSKKVRHPQLGGCRTAITKSCARDVKWPAREEGAPRWPRAAPAAEPVRSS